MPMVIPECSMIGRNRRDRRQTNHDQEEEDQYISETDPVPSIVSSTRSKPTISSLLFHANHNDNSTTPKKKSFTSGKFGGLGCAASSQVSVPAVIRTSANWEAKKVKKKKQKGKKIKATVSSSVALGSGTSDADAVNVSGINNNYNSSGSSLCALSFSSSCVAAPDVWCGPGTGLTTDAASVDYVVSRRPVGRGKVDGEKMSHRERPSCSVRRMVDSEDNPFNDYDAAVGVQHTGVEAFGHHRNSQNQNIYPEGLAEIVMLQSRLLLGGRLDGLDRYRDLRLDVDSMSYEELLELGDKIGHVSTGLREDEINRCLRNVKPSIQETFSLLFPERERKCSICQEEFEADDEIGKLNCRHSYHIKCIKLWLQHKNTCPVCKIEAKARS